jgi:TIR domain
MRKCFISYSRKDADFAKKLASNLEREEVVVWIDTLEIDVGHSIAWEVSQAIKHHDYFIAVLSPDYISSKWCKRELEAGMFRAIERKGILLPVLYRECEIPDLIADKIYADFRESYNVGFSQLLRSLHKARESTIISEVQTDLVIGEFEWKHNSSYGADAITQDGREERSPITFIREATPDSPPDEHDFSIEFDITSNAKSDLRITDIYVEVKNWTSFDKILRIVPYMGLGEKRLFFCLIDREPIAYPCRFEVPKGYVKLREREMEVIRLQINALNEGIYDLVVSVHYSVGGKRAIVSTELIPGIWFVSPQRNRY